MIGLDTNVLLRWLLTDRERSDATAGQIAAMERAILGASEPCFANAVVVAETLWVVGRVLKQPRSVQATIVERLIDAQNVRLSDHRAIEEALASFRAGGGDFADHLIGALNRLAGCATTLTFDKAASKSPDFTELTT
jgi:predicted nucleic-acid-binding protein